MSDCCLMPTQQFSAISWRKQQVNFHRDDDEVHFILDQHVYLYIYSASSLKQQSWFRANQSLLFLLNVACLAEKQNKYQFYSLCLMWLKLDLTIYCTRGEKDIQYTKDAFFLMKENYAYHKYYNMEVAHSNVSKVWVLQ